MEKERSCCFSGKIPRDIDDVEYCGVEVESLQKCCHGLQPVRRVAFQGTDTGRRFISCCMEDANRCDFICWCDPEWPVTMKHALEALWKKLDDKEQSVYCQIDSLLNHMLQEKLKAEKGKEEVENEMTEVITDNLRLLDEKIKIELDLGTKRAEFEEKMQVLKKVVEKKNKWFMISVSCNVMMFGVLASVLALKSCI